MTRISRRNLLGSSVLAGSALLLQERVAAQVREERGPHHADSWEPLGEPGTQYKPVVTPDGWTLPWQMVDGVKVFHLVAEEVEHEFAPGLIARCWGYNGSVHGPTIEAVEGDRVRVYVTNQLTAPTSVHWHGIRLPSGMDGVAGLNQPAIMPGETFVYEFTLQQHGTYMYHPHHDEMTQMAMGMMGMLIVHPRTPRGARVDRDYALMLSEWRIDPGARRPDPNEMNDFNLLTFNARAFPGTTPLVARRGERVRIRFGNLSAMDHHPVHLHGYRFEVTETDGGVIPESARWSETTVLVPVGSTRTIEFVADAPGDWAMHCHMTHHLMNQMGHGLPNMVGVNTREADAKIRAVLPGYMSMGQHGMGDMGEHIEAGHMPVPGNSLPMVGKYGPFGYITMGGMFTILKVREELQGEGDPGWYQYPEGSVARRASAEERVRDGLRLHRKPATKGRHRLHGTPATPHGHHHHDE